MQQMVMPEDWIVKAIDDPTSAIKQWSNSKGKTEMGNLQWLSNIINNVTQQQQKRQQELPLTR